MQSFRPLKEKITKWINDLPITYYQGHAIFALIIALILWPISGIVAGAYAGAFFYIGREIAQYEYTDTMDWKGLLYPVIPMIVIIIISHYI